MMHLNWDGLVAGCRD